jgi:hypothetical protein
MILSGSTMLRRPFFIGENFMSDTSPARETRKIYESPDGGKTIYVREFGSLERTLLEKKDARKD